MIRLQKLQLHSLSPIFSTRNEKYLCISVQNYRKITNKPAKVVNQSYMYWEQSLPLPLIYDKQYKIQIIQKIEKDNNINKQQKSKQQNNDSMKGSITFTNLKQSLYTIQIYSSTGNKKLAQLSTTILTTTSSITKHLLKSTQKLTTQSPILEKQKKVIRILSILAKLPHIYLKKAFIVIQIGQNIIKTPEIRSKGGELVFVGVRQIQLEDVDKQAAIKIIGVGAKQQEQPIVQAFLQLVDQKQVKKLNLTKDGFQIGQLYIEYRIVDKNLITTTNYVQNIEKPKDGKYNTIQVNQLQQNQLNYRKRNSISMMSKSIDYSNLDSKLSNFGMKSSRISRPPSVSVMDSSMISNTSITKRRNSVVNQNSNIVFSKEKRFQLYQDRQNQKITYLNQKERNFQFKFTNLGSKYKGAGLGYGDKVDFVRRDKFLPGVGDYRLPSIWDRY